MARYLLSQNLLQSLDRPLDVLDGVFTDFHSGFPFVLLYTWDFGEVKVFADSHGFVEMGKDPNQYSVLVLLIDFHWSIPLFRGLRPDGFFDN